jgi:hypothetical protein
MLKILNTKEQNQVLDQMYVRLCGPDADPEEIKKIIRDREMAFGHQHRGCASCKHSLQHAIADEMYMPHRQLSRRAKKNLDESMAGSIGKLPDWLQGHGADPVFNDWTVGTLLGQPRSMTAPADTTGGLGLAAPIQGDQGWDFDHSDFERELIADQEVFKRERDEAGPKRSQTAFVSPTKGGRGNARFKPRRGQSPTGNWAKSSGDWEQVRTATAPLGKTRYNMSGMGSPRERRLSPGFNITSPKSLQAAIPEYITGRINSRGVTRRGVAQNSSLSMVKSIYNAVTIDPHDKEYSHHTAAAVASFDRVALPRTDLGNKLERLGARGSRPGRQPGRYSTKT